jgi:sRNA-binding regulator protein Hfq
LEIDQQQMEARIGKQLADLTRPEARDWIKKLRSIADEIAPSQRVHYGVWPEAHEDREAAYLRQQRDSNATFSFKLFNGEQFDGTLVDFTPYTITVRPSDGDEVVLRKLAIAYYRRTGQGEGRGTSPSGFVATNLGEDALLVPAAAQAPEASEATAATPAQQSHDHARDDHHQPVVTDTDSDHVGEPDVPEEDNMDEDRGV